MGGLGEAVSSAFDNDGKKSGAGVADVQVVRNEHKKEAFRHTHSHEHTEYKNGKETKYTHSHEHDHDHEYHNGHKDDMAEAKPVSKP